MQHSSVFFAIIAFLFLTVTCGSSFARAHWRDDPKYPKWAQRGRILFLEDSRTDEATFSLLARYIAQGATPFIHAYTPHWPNDIAIVKKLEKMGIPGSVRVEGSLFFGDDHIDRFAFIHGTVTAEKFRVGGWWYGLAWRTNYNWYEIWPETMLGTARMRNGDEKLAYRGAHVRVRREGSPFAPQHRVARAKQTEYILTGVDPIPNVPMRAYENVRAKNPKVPYPRLGHYTGLWYDNPGSEPSYDLASKAAWQKHFKEKFGKALWDPAGHPDANVRREWARFWADAWVDYFLWRKELQDGIMRKRGMKYCFTGGNFSRLSRPNGTSQFYMAKKGIVDLFGPAEYPATWNRGRCHFILKAILAATHGRPGGKFVPSNYSVAESLAVCGCNAYLRTSEAAFEAANADLYGRTQPGGRVAVLFNIEQNVVEGQLVNFNDLADQITSMGYPYEVIIEDDLDLASKDLVESFPVIILSNTDLSPERAGRLRDYVAAGGSVIFIGDCLIEKPHCYDLENPPKWMPDRQVSSAVPENMRERVMCCADQVMPSETMKAAIDKLGGPGFRLEKPDKDMMINILRQPNGELTLLGIVNYSTDDKKDVAVLLPEGFRAEAAGWISRDGGGGMLEILDGRLVVPEIYYGCTVILGKDRNSIEKHFKKNTEMFPRKGRPELTGRHGRPGDWRKLCVERESLPAGRALCQYRTSAADRCGYLMLDIVAPLHVKAGEKADVDLRVLITSYDHVEYLKLIFEDTRTGERFEAPVKLPADNPYGEGEKLNGKTLTASWSPPVGKSVTYQVYLFYRVVSVGHDGEPFLEPEDVPAGYSGKTPRNLFLKAQPLMKRPYEDRLRGMRIKVL